MPRKHLGWQHVPNKISIRYSGVGTIPPIISYGNLLETNPAPEAFVLKWDDFSLVSCSPETILKKTGNRLVTRPIGGTTPRDASWAADRLKFDPKENAEHNMLIDLERNDLSRVCEPGSVHIEKLREVETYAPSTIWYPPSQVKSVKVSPHPK